MANKYNTSVESAQLICFFMDDGKSTCSIYDAYKWKLGSNRVYIRFVNADGVEKSAVLKSLHLKYRKKAEIRIGQNKRYCLSNTICEYRIVGSENFQFFIEEPDKNCTTYADFYSPEVLMKWISEGRVINAEFYEDAKSTVPVHCIVSEVHNIDFEQWTFENKKGFKVMVV